MKRYLPVILFFVVLVAPFVVQRLVRRDAEASIPDRSGQPPLELTIVTPHNQDIRRVFENAFSDWHARHHGRPVRITYLTPGGTNDIVRLLTDTYGPALRGADGKLLPETQIHDKLDIDMMWGGGDFPFEVELKPKGILKPVNIDPALFAAAFPTPDIAGVPLYEPVKPGQQPRWVGIALSGFGLVYNPTLYETLQLPPPQTWTDLAHPRLAGFVALADPTRSGSAASTYLTAVQRAMVGAEEQLFASRPDLKALSKGELAKNAEYQSAIARGWKQGMATLLLAAANARYFTDSASQVPNDVGNGDAAIGMAIDFYGRTYEEQVGRHRIRYVSPRAATSLNADPIAILYGVIGQREAVANRFVEFLLTPDGQRLWNLKAGQSPYLDRSLRRLPIRRDVYQDRTGWSDDVNPYEEAGGFNMRADWTGLLFSDMRPIWAAAWIDARGALQDAYERILSVKDVAERDRLLKELSDLPIEMDDVLKQRATRRKLSDEGKDARQWMTRQRIEWAQRFRDHYAAVASEAR